MEEALDLSFDRLLMMMMMMTLIIAFILFLFRFALLFLKCYTLIVGASHLLLAAAQNDGQAESAASMLRRF